MISAMLPAGDAIDTSRTWEVVPELHVMRFGKFEVEPIDVDWYRFRQMIIERGVLCCECGGSHDGARTIVMVGFGKLADGFVLCPDCYQRSVAGGIEALPMLLASVSWVLVTETTKLPKVMAGSVPLVVIDGGKS